MGGTMRRLGEATASRLHHGGMAALLAVVGLLLVGVPAQAAGRPGGPVIAAATSQADLSGVSCGAANACIAVGTLLSGSPVIKGHTLAESWNGTAWTMKSTPNPKGATDSNLYAVSCSAVRTCMAVGMYDDAAAPNGIPFAEVWNGTAWAIKPVPNPRGGTNTGLYGVSCSSAQACAAVGNTIIGGHNNAFSELWNGKTWALTTTPRPTKTTYSLLGAVSCRATTFCTAVGSYEVNNSSNSRTLAEAWNGKTWAIETTPNPKTGANGAELLGVACSSLLACTAVGSYDSPSNQGLPLAEGWNGKIWTIKATPNPSAAASSSLSAVSCQAANACMAIGSGGNGLFAESWNGTSWTVKAVPSPQGATFTSLSGVSCGAKDACVAVGEEFDSAQAEVPVAEAWNGTAWTIKPVPF
jgi:hypothetical protein